MKVLEEKSGNKTSKHLVFLDVKNSKIKKITIIFVDGYLQKNFTTTR